MPPAEHHRGRQQHRGQPGAAGRGAARPLRTWVRAVGRARRPGAGGGRTGRVPRPCPAGVRRPRPDCRSASASRISRSAVCRGRLGRVDRHPVVDHRVDSSSQAAWASSRAWTASRGHGDVGDRPVGCGGRRRRRRGRDGGRVPAAAGPGSGAGPGPASSAMQQGDAARRSARPVDGAAGGHRASPAPGPPASTSGPGVPARARGRGGVRAGGRGRPTTWRRAARSGRCPGPRPERVEPAHAGGRGGVERDPAEAVEVDLGPGVRRCGW